MRTAVLRLKQDREKKEKELASPEAREKALLQKVSDLEKEKSEILNKDYTSLSKALGYKEKPGGRGQPPGGKAKDGKPKGGKQGRGGGGGGDGGGKSKQENAWFGGGWKVSEMSLGGGWEGFGDMGDKK